MGCNGRDKLRRHNIRNIRLIKHNLENLPAERFGIPTSSAHELSSLKPQSDHNLVAESGDQNRNPNPNLDETGWGYCTEDQLEELLLKNLEFLYNEALSKLVELGYDEEVALIAILRNGHCYGSSDVLSNILQNCLGYLSSSNVNTEEPELVFADLRQLEEYSLAGMVCLLQQVRPQLSKGDAMWCLLMSDLHVGRASSMEIPVLPSSANNSNGENVNNSLNGIAPGNCKFHGGWGFGTGEACDFSVSGSFHSSFNAAVVKDIECPKRFNLPPSLKSMLQRNVTMFAVGFRANAKTTLIRPQIFSRSSVGVTLEHEILPEKSEEVKTNSRPTVIRSFGGSSMGVSLEPEILPEKSEGVKTNSRPTVIRSIGGSSMGVSLEPEILPERSEGYKANTKTKTTGIRSFGGSAVGVTLESEVSPEKSEGCKPKTKQMAVRTFGKSSMGVILEPENPPERSERYRAKPVAKRTMPVFGRLSLGVKLPDKPAEKAEEPRDSQNSDGVNSILSSLGNLSLDEKVEGGPPDQKNEMILNLIHQIKDLEGQVKERKEWAHQKAMQAARKLSQDLTELKTSRMERDETQRLKKGKQTLEDTTMKRLSEMENALRKASGQVDRANAAVRRLEIENAEIKAEMEASKLSASESVNTCLEVAKREKRCLKKLLAWEKQKSKLQEEAAEEKQKISQLHEQLALIKASQKETEINWRQELKAKELAITRAEEEQRSKEATEANAKRKTETLRRKIELDFQRHKDDIQRLEQELSRLRASVESTQTNSRTNTISTRESDITKTHAETNARILYELNQLQDSSDKEADYDRECMMCMKDEVSVVFLPCAHQVVCAKCSQDYGKKGKANCPCCRVQIEQRICVYGASS